MIYLDENGVTVKARKGAVIGKEYELNGKYYTVVDRQLLHNMYSSGMDLSLVVTTKITSLFSEFYWQTDFNQDISSWDVSNVKNMGEMFWGATSFNQNISKWDVSKVEKMSKMFDRASSFNGDISNWNVENVVEFDEMFKDATSFNQNIGDWKLNKLISTIGMFHGALSFNQDLNNWNVSNTKYMQRMFKGAIAFNGKIDNWNTSKVTNMNEIFMEAKTFNQNISDWDVSNVKSMIRMFKEAVSFNQNIGNWNVSNVNRFDETFKGAENFNNDISSWNVSKAKNMSGMFNGAKTFNCNISNWNVKNVTENSAIFKNALVFNEDYNPFPKKVIKQKPIKKNDSGIELSSEEKNTISKIKKFLIERNFDKIDFGLELLISLNNVKLFETLLQGCKIELSQDAWEKCNKLRTNDFFTGTGPAQPFLNYALFCIIANAPEKAKIDKSIVRKNMTSIDLKVFFSEYDLPNKFLPIEKFSALSKLKMDLNIFKVDYNVVDKKFNRDDWFVNNNITHLELSNTSGSLKWFKNFSHLKSLKFGFGYYGYPIEDIDSFEYLENIEELYLNNINQYERTFKNIDFLKNCKKIKKFHLEIDNRYSLENIDVIINFIELEEINMNGISSELNLEALLSCKKLKKISLRSADKIDLDCMLIKNCESLEKLELYGFKPFDIYGRVSEIGGLKGLLNLNKISFGGFNFIGINNGSLMTEYNSIINKPVSINDDNQVIKEHSIDYVGNATHFNDSLDIVTLPQLNSEDKKSFSEIKKLITTRDFDKIDLGLDKLISLNNIKLFEILLYGCKIELTQANQTNRFSHQMISNLRRNEFFTGTGPAQPYLNYALFCVIAHSPEEAKIDKSLVQKNMNSLDLKMFFSHYSSDLPTRFLPIVKFTALSFLKVDLSLFIEMDEGEHKKLNREDWFVNNKITDLELSNTSGSLKWFKNFSQLKSLKFELGYCSHPIGDIESFEYLENLEELYFNIKNYYQGFKNIDFLKKCKRIKKFHLNVEQYYNCKLVLENIDVIKNFSELEELKIDGISSKLNLGALLSCVKLKKLSIDARMFDFKLLRNCTSLETLTLSHYVELNINGKILDINQLKGLNNLKELTINNVQIKGIDNTVFL